MMFSIGLGFTSNCNMNCPFCYSRNTRLKNDDCSVSEWIGFIDRNSKYIKDINYGTGENTTSETWYNFITYVRKNHPHIKQALTTNGVMSNIIENNVDKRIIIQECIDEIDVSLDFGKPEIHNYYRGNEKAYEWALNTLLFCKLNRKDATIVLLGIDETLNSENLNSIFEIAKTFESKVRINLYRPVDKNSRIKPVSFEKIDWLFNWINQNQEFLSISDPLFSSLYFRNYIKPDPSGISSVRIIHTGDIYPSTYLLSDELKMGNIKDFNFLTIEANPIYKMIRDIQIPKECSNCELKMTCCGGVLDRRYLWYGSFSERDPYCPTRYNMKIEDVFKEGFTLSNREFSSVHDGYLPTLFFGYKKD